MRLSDRQMAVLGSLISEVNEKDSLGCDGCFELMSQYADSMIAGRDLHEALQAVEIHLEQCRCCRDEYEALRAALSETGVA
jgi:hypothetical protein